MNNIKLAAAVAASVQRQLFARGFVAPVDLLLDIGVLSKEDYENWRFKRVEYLERVCKVNLHKLATIMHELRSNAAKRNLKPSVCAYVKWGKGAKVPLRFSKYGNPNIERNYATHYVDAARVAQLKAKAEAAKQAKESQAVPTTEGAGQ